LAGSGTASLVYAAPTPNGVKVSIMLEETGLPYEPHFIDISRNEDRTGFPKTERLTVRTGWVNNRGYAAVGI
jgi:hypothetical protein